jgi:hypothetical protein
MSMAILKTTTGVPVLGSQETVVSVKRFLRHAIGAAEIALVHHRYPQIV